MDNERTITYDIRRGHPLKMDHEYAHCSTIVQFQGFTKQIEDSTVYLCMGAPLQLMVPLTDDYAVLIVQTYTRRAGTFKCQLLEAKLAENSTDTYEYMRYSDIFHVIVTPSLAASSMVEVTDPRLELVYTQMHEAYLTMLAHEQTASASATAAATEAASAYSEARNADTSAREAEGFAIGEQNGEAVIPGSYYYENNAKYYSEQAASSATTATTKASEASASATSAASSATTATTKASEAAASATAAATSATAAAASVSEVTDIRVGTDGTTYATAGDAVRGQIADIRATKILDASKIAGNESSYYSSGQIKSGGAGVGIIFQTEGAATYKITKTFGNAFRLGYVKASKYIGADVYDWSNHDGETSAKITVPADATYIYIYAATSGSTYPSASIKDSMTITKYTHAYDEEAENAINAMRAVKTVPNTKLISSYGNLNNATLFIGGTVKAFYFPCKPNTKYVISIENGSSSRRVACLHKAPASGDAYYNYRGIAWAPQLIINTDSDSQYIYLQVGDPDFTYDDLLAGITITEYGQAIDYEAREEISTLQSKQANEVFTMPRNRMLMTVGYDEEFYDEAVCFPTGYKINIKRDSAVVTRTLTGKGTLLSPQSAATGSNSYGFWFYNNNAVRLAQKDYLPFPVKALNLASCSLLALGDSTIDQSEGGVVKHLSDIFTGQSKTLTLLGTLDASSYPNEGRAGWSLADYVGQTERGRNEAASANYTNPFWNATAQKFDFSYYMTQQGYSGVDYVVIQLGTNDFSGIDWGSPYTKIVTMYGWLKEIIDSILEYNNGVRVILNLPTTVNSDESLIAQTSNIRYLQIAARALYNSYVMENIIQDYSWSSVRPSYCHMILDADTDFNDSVHPNTAGYLKMAKEVINQLNHFMNG